MHTRARDESDSVSALLCLGLRVLFCHHGFVGCWNNLHLRARGFISWANNGDNLVWIGICSKTCQVPPSSKYRCPLVEVSSWSLCNEHANQENRKR